MQKKLHRFLVPHIPSEQTFTLGDDALTHQIAHVLKLHPGETCVLFVDKGNDIVVSIDSIAPEGIVFKTIQEHIVAQPSKKIIASIAIPKGDVFERIVQKLTEIGVSEIVPLLTARTIKQSVRLDRLQSISDEALEQCGGTHRVVIHEPLRLSACLEKFPFPSVVFQKDSDNEPVASDTVVMYVGPEGGWSDEDIELFSKHAVLWKNLGHRTLRTETATIVGAYELLR